MINGKLTSIYKEALEDDLIRSLLDCSYKNEDVLNHLVKHHEDIFPSPPEFEYFKQVPFFPIFSWSNNIEEIIEQEKDEGSDEDEVTEESDDEEDDEFKQIFTKSIEHNIIDIRAIAMYSIIKTIKEDKRLKNLVIEDKFTDFNEFRNELGSVVKEEFFNKFEESIKEIDIQNKYLPEVEDQSSIETFFEHEFNKVANTIMKEISRNLSTILMMISVLGILPSLINVWAHKWYLKSVRSGNYGEDIIDVIEKLEENEFITPSATSVFCTNCLSHKDEEENEQEHDEESKPQYGFFYANVPVNVPLDYNLD